MCAVTTVTLSIVNQNNSDNVRYRPGFGEGADKWLIHLKGGGWCVSEKDCADWVSEGYQSGSGNLHYNMTGKGESGKLVSAFKYLQNLTCGVLDPWFFSPPLQLCPRMFVLLQFLPNRAHTHLCTSGIMSINPKKNPNYFNWNIVYTWYCDGGSYVGHHPYPKTAKDSNNQEQTMYMRGSYVFSSIITTLKYEHDMKSAADIMLVCIM